MSKNWDSTMNSAHASPNGVEGGRSIEYTPWATRYVWCWVDAANVMWYAHGWDAAWNVTQLSGALPAGELNHAVNVGEVALAIDHTTGHVHIAYTDTTNNRVYHAECTNAIAPVAANWTVFGANTYQRCDSTVNVKTAVSIAVDSATGNGTRSPHVVWQEAGTSIRYNCSILATHAMGADIILANTPGETSPTIIVAEDEGREPYVFWVDAAGTSIECMKCLDAANPQVVGNWGGPAAGAGGGPDVALAPNGGADTAISAPSASWWWDADERVIVAAVLTGVGGTESMVTNYWDETAGPAAWAGQLTASQPSFTPTGCMITNRGAANKWTAYVMDNGGGLEYALKDNSYSFAGLTWYAQATTPPAAASYFSAEWRHLEVISANHSVVVWVDAAGNLWYGETRINTSSAPVIVSPTAGAYHNELETIDFDWTFTDTEADTQREYYAEIDDDIAFGSPVADPGTNFRLNTQTASALDDQTLNASVLTADTTYYWRVKTWDSEYGTEYDPDSDGPYSDGSDTLKTTPQVVLDIVAVTQQADKDVYIDMDITVQTEDDDADDDNHIEFVAAEYDSGGGYVAMTNIPAENTPDGDGDTDPTDIDPLTIGSPFRYTYAWDADADLAAEFDGDVDIRITFRYLGNSHGLGNDTDTQLANPIDFKPPAQAIGVPDGLTVIVPKPTLNATVTDTTGFVVQFEIHGDVGFTSLHEASGYLTAGVDAYTLTSNLTRAGTWWFRAKSKDTSPSENENAAWVTGSFTYSPPPDPVECQDGTFTLEIDPTKLWAGSEFDTVAMGDVIGNVKLEENLNAPNRLTFKLNNYNGRFIDPTSAFVIQKGDEVKMVKGDKSFYGTITNYKPLTRNNRQVEVYCESFSSAAEREPIQIRMVATESSGLCFEDYIKIAARASGLAPKWFQIVDADGNEIFLESASNKTPVLSGNPILLNKVSFVELLNEYSDRTGKVWWESSTPPTGRKASIYLAAASDPSEGTADHTLHVEKDVLEENLNYDFDTLINRVMFTDADVVEQDMDSIREHGVFLHKMRAGSSSTVDEERLIEIAQHILNNRSTPRAFGSIPLAGEYDISPNDLVQIYEEGSDDTKSGFSGLYLVAGVDTMIGETTTTTISLSSRWENPLVQDLLEMLKEATASGSDEVLTVLRVETAEARLEVPANGVDLSSEATYVAARLGMDRYEDTDTDANYYSVYGDQ